MDNANLLYDIIKDQAKDIEEVKESLKEMTLILEENTESLKTHMRRSDALEARVEQVAANELICPGKKAAEWNAGLINRGKDFAILIGVAITLLKLFRILP